MHVEGEDLVAALILVLARVHGEIGRFAADPRHSQPQKSSRATPTLAVTKTSADCTRKGWANDSISRSAAARGWESRAAVSKRMANSSPRRGERWRRSHERLRAASQPPV